MTTRISGVESEYPIPAKLCLNGWQGLTKTPCLVVRATPTKYRIEATQRMRLGGRNRWLEPGKTALVPRRAVELDEGLRMIWQHKTLLYLVRVTGMRRRSVTYSNLENGSQFTLLHDEFLKAYREVPQ